MKTIERLICGLLTVLLLSGISRLAAQPPEKGLPAKESASEEGVTAGLLASYIDKMGYVYEINTTNKVPEMSLTMRGENNQFDMRIFIDEARKVVYVCVNRLLYCPASHPRHALMMQRLMELNWQLLVGKYEWDKEDGEVRLSYTFSTENGLGYESFAACFQALIMTADQHYPELMRIMWASPLTGESPKVKPKPEAKPQPATKVEPKPTEELQPQVEPQPVAEQEPAPAEEPQPGEEQEAGDSEEPQPGEEQEAGDSEEPQPEEPEAEAEQQPEAEQ